MKKRIIKNETADKLLATLFLLAGLISLNVAEKSVASNALGIVFLIIAVYGAVCIFKKKKFLF